MPARINGNGDHPPSRSTRIGNVAALARVIRQMEPETPPRGPDALAARRRMVAAFFRMLDQRGLYKAPAPSYAPPDAASIRAADLPPRLGQILNLLLKGEGEKQITRKLGLSPHTVHYYVKALHKRFEVSSRAELLARFISPASLPAQPQASK